MAIRRIEKSICIGSGATTFTHSGDQQFAVLALVARHFAGAAICLLGRRSAQASIGYRKTTEIDPKLQAIEGAVLSPRPNPFNIQIVDLAGRRFFFPASPLRSP